MRSYHATYRKGEVRSHHATYRKRWKIAKYLHEGVSNFYYSTLNKTPVDELFAGNLSRSLSKEVLKNINSEVNHSTQLQDNVLFELIMAQNIMKECDTFTFCPGYIQHIQIDHFAVHLFTKVCLEITAYHLKTRKPITLLLDATGGVVSKIPNQEKRVLYYCLALPGGGRNRPPLPVTEMITNDHTIPNVFFWLMKTISKLSMVTTSRVHQVETHYSWALIQSVLLAFNKENMLSTYVLCSQQRTLVK